MLNKSDKVFQLLFLVLCSIGMNANSEVGLIIPKEFHPYETDEQGKWYVRLDDRSKVLQEILPKEQFEESEIEDWLRDGIYSYIIVSEIKISRLDVDTISFEDNGNLIVPDDFNNKKIYDYILNDLKSSWGKYSFSYYDKDHDVGRFINEAGAFVFITLKVINDELVVIESMDLIHMQLSERNSDTPLEIGKELSTQSILKKIEVYSKA